MDGITQRTSGIIAHLQALQVEALLPASTIGLSQALSIARKFRVRRILSQRVPLVTMRTTILQIGAPSQAASWIHAHATWMTLASALGSLGKGMVELSTTRMLNVAELTPSLEQCAQGTQMKLCAMQKVDASAKVLLLLH
jgi:hypothetical protein